MTTGFLLLSGIALLGDGIAPLQALLGGHVAAGRWHRWVGLALIALGLLVVAARRDATRSFVVGSVRFRWSDLAWLRAYPRFIARPSHATLPRHEGHFDPGQRALNIALTAAFLALSGSGILMAFPDYFRAEVYAWNLQVHRAATWVLLVLVAGHVVVASGVLPAYRGIWRAMHGSGRIDRELAHRLWPRWAEDADKADGIPRRRP